MDYDFLKKYSDILSDKRLSGHANLSFEIERLIAYSNDVKHDLLLDLVTQDINNRNDFLDYNIALFEPLFIEKQPNNETIIMWLNKYNITIENLLESIITHKRLDSDLSPIIYNTIKENYDLNEEEKNIRSIQMDFFKYFCNYFGHDLISFINSKKVKMNNLQENTNINDAEKIKWIGKPSQLGFIIGKLVELGYIEAPERRTGDVNYTRFAEIVKTTFDVNTTEGTLSKYLNLESEKGQETERKFNDNSFNIPHIKEVS